MTERDFDKIFQDKIGDELPFDFRPDDWLAAEQELDKMLPTAAPVAPALRLLTWHKWAAAATILLLGSQLYLMSELRSVKQEVVSLHQENTALKTSEKADNKAPLNTQSIIIQHDTIVKTVIVDVPQKSNTLEKVLKENGLEKADFDNFIAHQNAVNDTYEAGSRASKSNKLTPLKTNLDGKNNQGVSVNTDKTPLQTVENTSKINVQKDSILTGQKPLMSNNSAELNQNNSVDITKDKSVVNALTPTNLIAVKSINRAKNWLDDDIFDFMPAAKRPIIKPISEPNGWEIAANTLFLTNDDHRHPQSRNSRGDDDRLSIGANLRLSYHIKKNIRLSAEADFWSERHRQDTSRRPPVAQQPPSDYILTRVEQSARSFQLRFGADYKFRQIIGLQPFVGIGFGYQKRLKDDFEYDFRKGNASLPLSIPNENKLDKPIFVSLRAGVDGKIYRRLNWSFDVNAQRGNTLSSHLGLKYVL
jgi:hypothetical protein